jgi:hypothetical protein
MTLKQRKAAALQRSEKGLRKFRARKSDWGKYVFVGVDGARLAAGSRKQGFLVYFSKTGKRKVLNQKVRLPQSGKSKKVKYVYKSSKFLSISQRKITEKKEAAENIQGISYSQQGEWRVNPTKGEKGSISFPRFARSVSKRVEFFISRYASQRNFYVEFTITVETRDGEAFTYQGRTPILLSNDFKKGLSSKQIYPFFRTQLWAEIGEVLKEHEMVTVGSAKFIYDLSVEGEKVNHGQDREEWVTRSGEPWEKWDYQNVKVKRYDWRLIKATLQG